MKVLPFPSIRPAQDRVIEAMSKAETTLASNDSLREAIAQGLLLKDPGAAYYIYECSGAAGAVTGVVAICPVGVLGDEASTEPSATNCQDAGGNTGGTQGEFDAAADKATANEVAADNKTATDANSDGTAIAELKVQPRPVSLTYDASPVMDIILGAAKEGAALYAVTDPAGTTHRVWEVKREDAVGAIRAMLDQAPEPSVTGDDAYAAALASASRQLVAEAKQNGSFTGKEPFNYVLSALFPAAQVTGAAPQMPAGMLTHQIARF